MAELKLEEGDRITRSPGLSPSSIPAQWCRRFVDHDAADKDRAFRHVDSVDEVTAGHYTLPASRPRSLVGVSRTVGALAKPDGSLNAQSPGCITSGACAFDSNASPSSTKRS